MDQRREAYREQVALIVNDPNIPDHAKVMFQNAMGALYYQSGIETITSRVIKPEHSPPSPI